MKQDDKPLWNIFLEQGLVKEPKPNLQTDSPWYIKLLLAISGWLAATFLLGFIGVGFQYIFESHTASFVTGSILIGIAFSILRVPKNEFAEHLALAASLTGQALLIYVIFEKTAIHSAVFWLLIASLEIALALLMPSFLHRVLSSFVAMFALSLCLDLNNILYVFSGLSLFIVGWLWLNEFRWPRHSATIRAVAYGIVLALIQQKATTMFGFSSRQLFYPEIQTFEWLQPWMGEALLAAATLYLVWSILQHYQSGFGQQQAFILAMTLLICLASFEAHGLSVGIAILLLGFFHRNRTLYGLGIVTMLFFISSYYYLLQITLLYKSISLLAIGVLLLVIRWLMLRVFDTKGETQHG